jgi:hypothetical protein
MPHPSTVHTNSALSTFIAGYRHAKYIADDVCPIIETEYKSDAYQQYLRADMATPEADLVAANGMPNEVDYSVTTGNYLAQSRALSHFVPQETTSNADEPHDPLEHGSMVTMAKLMLMREIRVASLIETAANYSGNTSAASNPWSDPTNGTPLVDLDTAINGIAEGMEEDTRLVAIMAKELWDEFRRHPDVLGAASLKPRIDLSEAASLIGVDEVIVTSARKNTADPPQTPSYSRIWDATKCAVLRLPTGEPRGEAGLFCATFRWKVDGVNPVNVQTWDEPGRGLAGGTWVKVSIADDEVAVQPDMGYLLTSVS